MAGNHSLLSPSAADRWLYCTASVARCAGLAEKTSEYADEINRLADLRRKVSRILRAERAAQYAAEAQEAAARG